MILGKRLFLRERYVAAAALVLSPILLISTLVPTIGMIVIGKVAGRWLEFFFQCLARQC